MTIFLQTSSTGVPSSACFSAEAICCSVNLLLFTAWLLFYGGIMPEFLFLNGTIYWGRVTASLWDILGRLETLFDVQHLFPHLLDQHLHLHRDASRFDVGRLFFFVFGLTMQILHQEVEAPADGPRLTQDAPHLGQMRIEAVELLFHVETLAQQDHLLLEALRIELGLHLGEARSELFAKSHAHFRQTLAGLRRLGRHGLAPLRDEFLKLGALARARRRQLRERLIEQRERSRRELFDIGRRRLHHARPAQNLERTYGGGMTQQRIHLGRRRHHTLRLFRIKGQYHRQQRRRQPTQQANDQAAQHRRRHSLAQRRLDHAQLFGQARRELKITMIHRTQLPHQRPPRRGSLAAREGSHTMNHLFHLGSDTWPS